LTLFQFFCHNLVSVNPVFELKMRVLGWVLAIWAICCWMVDTCVNRVIPLKMGVGTAISPRWSGHKSGFFEYGETFHGQTLQLREERFVADLEVEAGFALHARP
jgi:hypothetical protein